MDKFVLKSSYKPTGDQPQAIKTLTEGLLRGEKGQTLLGVTGSGKTFTMANIIANVNKPTIIFEPNKTLAAQVCSEMKELFPDNAVEFLFPIMTIISLRHTFLARTFILKRTQWSMMKLIS